MKNIYNETDSLYKSVKKFETSGVWTGQTAYGWVVKAHQNCHNGIARLNNFAVYMGALCDSAAEHAKADGKEKVYSDLLKVGGKFEVLCENCVTSATTYVGKSFATSSGTSSVAKAVGSGVTMQKTEAASSNVSTKSNSSIKSSSSTKSSSSAKKTDNKKSTPKVSGIDYKNDSRFSKDTRPVMNNDPRYQAPKAPTTEETLSKIGIYTNLTK